jgi:hypothetical protein
MKLKRIERPGYMGKRRIEKYLEFDKKYGKGNWEIVWEWGEMILDFKGACKIYEDAYFFDSMNRVDLWKHIFSIASNVYDNNTTNINSGLDYKIQEAISIHIQDIAVRNVGLRRGWKFKGDQLIQIRGPKTEGYELMPGIVPFHNPELILAPNIAPKWAGERSVESFYQNNRWLVVKR